MDRRRFGARWAVIGSLLASVALSAATPSQAETTYVVNNTDASSQGNEIVAITPDKQFALVVGTNSNTQRLRSLRINPNGTLGTTQTFDFKTVTPVTGLGLTAPVASSIAVHPSGTYAIATIQEDNVITDTEKVGGALFLNIDSTTGALSLARNTTRTLGRHPESIAIAPNGKYAVVANKDPGAGVGTNTRGGTISVLDLQGAPNNVTVNNISVTVPAANTSDSADPAPETVAISPDSTRAYVTLQENSALAIVTINPDTLATSTNTVAFPRQLCPPGDVSCSPKQLYVDGIAVTPDGNFLVTANKGRGTVRADSVSLMSVTATSVTLVTNSGTALADAAAAAGIVRPTHGFEPEHVDIAQVGGQLKAFVTLSGISAVAVFNLNLAAPNSSDRMVFERLVRLDTPNSGAAGNNPEGIDVVNTFGNQTLAITANTGASRNLSVITANGDDPTVSFSAETFNAREDSGQATVTVTLSGSSYEEVRVNYSTSNGTGVGGVDYTPTTSTLIFAPGETSKTFQVPLINNLDANPGEDKTVNLLLDTPVNATIADGTATLAIADDETTILEFSAPTYSINENVALATVRINRAGGLGQAVSVQVATSDGSATAGSDYTAVTETVEFGVTDTFKDVTIPIANDSLIDPDETVNLTLSSPSNGARLGTQTTAVLTIVDDEELPVASFANASFDIREEDGIAVITVNLNAPSTQPVTVDYTTSDGTATSESDYIASSGTLTFAPGETTKTFRIVLIRDNETEETETVLITLTSATGGSLSSTNTATLTIQNSKPIGGKVYIPTVLK